MSSAAGLGVGGHATGPAAVPDVSTEDRPTRTDTGWIRTLDPEEVADDVIEHVLDVADRASAVLALRVPVEIIFFTSAPPDHPDAEHVPHLATNYGFHVRSRPGHVYIRHGRTLAETERTIVHELRHEFQRVNVNGLEGPLSRAEIEADAHAWADAWMVLTRGAPARIAVPIPNLQRVRGGQL